MEETGDQDKVTAVNQENITAKSVEVDRSSHNSGGLLVLQWLSYAFWFWCMVSVAWLASVAINYFIANGQGYYENWGDLAAYPLASVLIMLIIALVTDIFYAKKEPVKKTSGSNIIMLLHVVPFILTGIGAVIVIVFSLIRMLISSDPASSVDGTLHTMAVSAVVAVLIGMASARVYFGGRFKIRQIAWIVFGLVSLVFIVMSIMGPVAQSLRTKNDQLIEQAIPLLVQNISSYTSENDKLPDSLSEVTHYGGRSSDIVQAALDKKLITYNPNSLKSEESSASVDERPSIYRVAGNYEKFYYQLCTVFAAEKKNQYSYSYEEELDIGMSNADGASAEDYNRYYVGSINSHPAGDFCYNLYANGKYKNSDTELTE